MKNIIKESIILEKPMWLLQNRKSDLPYVQEELGKKGVTCEMVELTPKELIPLQQKVKKSKVDYFKDKIDNNLPLEPIFISKDNSILDGHHRAYAFMSDPSVKRVVCFKIYLDKDDAIQILNRIEDKFDFENNFNPHNSDFLNFDKFKSDSDDISDLNTDEKLINQEDEVPSDELMNFETVKFNPQTLTLYKNCPINTKSRTGDFLSTKPTKNFNHKYNISFNNLLEIDEEEIKNYPSPIQYIVEKWFSDVNLKEESVKQALTQEIYTYRKINEKANQLKIDGIKYGDRFVQTIN